MRRDVDLKNRFGVTLDVARSPQINSGMDIYHQFYQRGLTASQRHFSSAWLGRADNYLCLRAGRGPSSDALVSLFQTLVRKGHLMLAVRVAWTLLWLKPEALR